MRDYIAVIVAVLGVLLVLAGATLIVLRALAEGKGGNPPPVTAAPEDVTTEVPSVRPEAAQPMSTRLAKAVSRPTAADRLIMWGIVLLVLAAIAAGAITFNLGATGGGD